MAADEPLAVRKGTLAPWLCRGSLACRAATELLSPVSRERFLPAMIRNSCSLKAVRHS